MEIIIIIIFLSTDGDASDLASGWRFRQVGVLLIESFGKADV